MSGIYALVGRVAYPLLLPIMRPVLRRTRRAYVVIVCGGEVLLVKNWLARNTWRLPGGGVKRGEEPLDAAAREVKEELGILLDYSDLRKIHTGIISSDNLGLVYDVFVVFLDKKPLLSIDPFEIIDAQFFDAIPSHMHEDFIDLVRGCMRVK